MITIPCRLPRRRAAVLAALLLGSVFAAPVLAQFGGPPPGDRPPFGRPPFGRPPGGGPGMRGPRPMTAADAPMAALTVGLRLTAPQQAKIGAVQTQLRQQRDSLRPRPGGPPDFEAMRAAMDRMRGLDRSASAQVQAVLTGPQKAALPALLQMLDNLRAVGILPATYAELSLSGAQKAQIETLARTARAGMRPPPGGGPPDWQAMRAAREQTAQKAMGLLSGSQAALVTRYKAAHPRPGGFGGGRGPGFGPGRGFGPPPGGFGPPPPEM